MCIVTDVIPELKTAEKDIVVYKEVMVFRERKFFGIFTKLSIFSAIKYFTYKLNKEYQTTLDSFRPYYAEFYISARGFYSWKDKNPFINVQCIIPKGSKYYLVHNDREDRDVYISDRIKLIELI